MLSEATCPHCGQYLRDKIAEVETRAILACLQRGPLGTHEIAVLIGRKEYGDLHQRLNQMKADGLIVTNGYAMRRTESAQRRAGRQRIWELKQDSGTGAK